MNNRILLSGTLFVPPALETHVSGKIASESPRGGTLGNSWWGFPSRFSKSLPHFRLKSVIFKKIFLKILSNSRTDFFFFLRVDFHCREIFTCVYKHVNFTRGNKIEARVTSSNVKLSEVQLLCLRATFHTLKNYPTVEIHPNTLGIETINTFIQSCSSLENHTRFQPKTVFRPKRAQKLYPCGCTHLYGF